VIGTAIGIYQQQEFSLFQFFRTLAFPLVLIGLIKLDIRPELFRVLAGYLRPTIIIQVVLVLLFFSFGLNAFNSTLDIPFDHPNPRVFVFPVYLFHLLFIRLVFAGSAWQYPCLLLLLATASKVSLAYVAITYLCLVLSQKNFPAILAVLIGYAAVAFLAWRLGLLGRIGLFIEEGDPWRTYEPLAALLRLSDPLVFFVGMGAGVPYWEGRAAVVVYDEVSRVIENSRYDVHNGALSLFLRFGVVIGVWYLVTLFRSIVANSAAERIALCAGLALFILTSHGPVQTAEAMGVAVGIAYLRFLTRSAQIRDIIHSPISRGAVSHSP
jgi:hypothetical protein